MADSNLSFDKSQRDLGGAKRRGNAPRIAKSDSQPILSPSDRVIATARLQPYTSAQQPLGLLLCMVCRMADSDLSFDKSQRDLGGAKRRGNAPRIAKSDSQPILSRLDHTKATARLLLCAAYPDTPPSCHPTRRNVIPNWRFLAVQ